VDLAQDSDEENMQIRKWKRNQPEVKPYDCEFDYFEPPTHGPNDVSTFFNPFSFSSSFFIVMLC
jgi:hypothetical protein